MDAARKAPAKTNGRKATLGLAANGSSGGWEVAIDESLDGREKWFAQIEGPSLYLYFQIPSPGAVGDMIRFFEQCHPAKEKALRSPAGDGPKRVGGSHWASVRLLRDAERPEGCYLMVGPGARPCARFFLAGEDVANLTRALKQAQEDLDQA
jgi:hypothetical protein